MLRCCVGVYFNVREEVVLRGDGDPVVSLMRVVDNGLGAEGAADVGQWLMALTALQTLNLRGNAVYSLCCFLHCGLMFVRVL